MGVDVARGGRDRTVLARRHGWWWDGLVCAPGETTKDGYDVQTLCMKHLRDGAPICLDVVGAGAGAYDVMRPNLEIIPFDARMKGNIGIADKMEFYNRRCACYWLMRKVLDPANGLNAALPDDPKLLDELTSVRYSRETGKVKAERKDDVKKRLGKSPDRADAVIMSLLNWKDTEGSDVLRATSARPIDMAKLYGEPQNRTYRAQMGGNMRRNNNSWMSV